MPPTPHPGACGTLFLKDNRQDGCANCVTLTLPLPSCVIKSNDLGFLNCKMGIIILLSL